MTLSTPVLRGGAAGSQVPVEAIDTVLRRTEDTFVWAGDSLGAAVDILRGTEALFARLDVTLGDETSAQLGVLIEATFGNVEAIRADFDTFLRQSDGLRASVRGVRLEVNELDRVIRTISNVSINARIQGNGLVPPRPQVNSFIERLAAMASEAESILREVKDAMVGIGHDTAAMDVALQELRQELTTRVLPALSRFAVIAQRVQDGRDEMTRTSADLAARMKAVFTEVSRLIMALQSGDSTRQRLERVREIVLDVGDHGDAALDAVLLDLARALADAAKGDAAAEIGVSVEALDLVRRSADTAMQTARQFYFGQTGQRQDAGAVASGSSDAAQLDGSIARVRRHLVAMRSRADDLRGRLDVILKHEATIRQIAQQVRLSGLNAVLICAKLGKEGRSLRELAQWLRTLTDESDAIVQRLQVSLDDTRQRTREAGQAGVDRLEEALSGFIGDAEALNGAMVQIDAVVTETARGFDAAGKELPLRLGHAAARLSDFRAALGDLDPFLMGLAWRRMLMADPVLPFADASLGAEVLGRLRRRYTMQQERAIHDGITGAGLAALVAAPPQASLEEDLDDILF
jgi:methyl-accepting chemotaxis protein